MIASYSLVFAISCICSLPVPLADVKVIKVPSGTYQALRLPSIVRLSSLKRPDVAAASPKIPISEPAAGSVQQPGAPKPIAATEENTQTPQSIASSSDTQVLAAGSVSNAAKPDEPLVDPGEPEIVEIVFPIPGTDLGIDIGIKHTNHKTGNPIAQSLALYGGAGIITSLPAFVAGASATSVLFPQKGRDIQSNKEVADATKAGFN